MIVKTKIKLISSIVLILFSFNFHLVAESNDRQVAYEFNLDAIKALETQEYLVALDFLERALMLLPEDKTLMSNLSVAYNNYAIHLSEDGYGREAKEYLYKAIEAIPKDIQAKKNLVTIIYNYAGSLRQKGKYAEAINELKEALGVNPEHVPSLILLGQIYYQQQELKKAKELWDKAYRYDRRNDMLNKLRKKLKEEEQVENNLRRSKSTHFNINYDKEMIGDEVYDIRYYLKEAYREIGQDFNFFPEQEIVVLLYKKKDFKSISRMPDWVGGIFDGKIRLPVTEEKIPEKEMKRLIWHEYTHAIVYEIGGGNCPKWFNEGLATWEESKQATLNLEILKKAINNKTLIPLESLNSYLSVKSNSDKVHLAYLEAYTFIEFLLERRNFYTINQLLKEFKKGKSADEAFRTVFYRSFNRINNEWLEFLKERY